MTTELSIQSSLVKEAFALGGYALKMSNRFLVGVPDLLVHLPASPTVIVEIKLAVAPTRLTTPISVDLTVQQRYTLQKMQKAGVKSGWCLFVANKSGRNPDYHSVFVSTDLTRTHVLISELNFTRKRGDQWPIQRICQNLTS